MSNGLDLDQDRHSVHPDLGPNCLQRLSAGDKSSLARKELSQTSRPYITERLLMGRKESNQIKFSETTYNCYGLMD